MLTDIFAYRYADRPIWNEFRGTDRVLLLQGFRIVSEQLFPAGKNGKMDVPTKNAWNDIHSKISMEIGLESLSPLCWDYRDSDNPNLWGAKTIDSVCKTWLLAEFKQGQDVDVFMKQRISFIELAFREGMEALADANTNHQSMVTTSALKRKMKANSMDSVIVACSRAETLVS